MYGRQQTQTGYYPKYRSLFDQYILESMDKVAFLN